jgi:hypothetical protein
MRLASNTAANSFAWVAIICLVVFAGLTVILLGSFGLIVLGLATLFVCTRFSLDEDAPTWSTAAFQARMLASRSPEQRAAEEAARVEAMAPLRFYRWCGVVLLVAGIAGFVWQRWH